MSLAAWNRFTNTCARTPDATALWHGDASATYSDLSNQARDWAGTIKTPPGSRVILYAANSIPLIAATLGIWRSGATPVWVNADAPHSHLINAVDQTEATAIIADKCLPNIDCRVITKAAENCPHKPPHTTTNAPGSIVYTSGSTGQPKGVMQSAETLISGAIRTAQTLGYTDTDRILCPVPFAFDYGWGQLLTMAFIGTPLILPAPANAFGLCAAITTHRPTVLASVPAVLSNLFSGLSPIRDCDRSSIRLITNTGSRIPENTLATLWNLFPDAALSLNYGLTETYRSASLPTSLAAGKPHSVGSALPGVILRILAPDGTPCAPHETGEIIHSGAGVFDGYWNDPIRTAQVRKPDPQSPASIAVFTGDLGYLDDAGHLTVIGRRDRQIKSMGVRVSPDEIEDILLATGHMAEVAITTRPDDMVGDLITAFAVPAPGTDAAAALKALKRSARQKLSPYMTPRIYHLIDALPRNPNGKVDYPALKSRAAEDL